MSAVGTVTQPDEKWDVVIRPQAGWLDLHLRELWRYKDLILLFVRRDFVAQYKQTVLGPTWFVLQPLMQTIVFTVVFGRIAKLSTDGLPETLFYLSGTLVWGYFANSLRLTSDTFTANRTLFGKVYFPRLAVPVSIVISQLIRFGLQFVLFLCFMAFFRARGDDIGFTRFVFLFPVLVLIMALLGLGLGIIFSAMTTKYRDLRFLLQFGIQLLMYATPVVYPVSTLAGKYQTILLLNPMTPVIETFRHGFLGAGSASLWHLLYSGAVSVFVLFVGLMFFSRIERTFMDTV